MNKFIFLLLFLLLACAQPHYAPNGTSLTNQQNSDPCAIAFTHSHVCLLVEWEQLPTKESPGSFILQSTLESLPTNLLGQLSIILWMPSMGHGSSPVTVEQIGTGRYRAKDVFFVMPGDWEIRYQLKDGEKILDQAVQKIFIP